MTAWLSDALHDPGPFELDRLSGGNSNETLLATSPSGEWILRRPPQATIDAKAHDMSREFRILSALAGADVPTPRPFAFAEGTIVMERIHGVPLTDALPPAYPPGPASVTAVGEAAVDALAKLHTADWRAAGLEDFGRPAGFLERQVGRWRKQYARYACRDMPRFEEVAAWLEEHRPPDGEPGILHGDFHLDNCLFTTAPPIAVAAIIDWEMATIGDPLLDLGLLLAFWGPDRPDRPAMPHVQACTRVAGVATRAELAARYAERSGRSVEHLPFYLALAFWKLAAIVEGAYANHLAGKLDTPYARALEHDVPALLDEAAAFAGLRARR